jgi:hypothetical protein
MMWEAISGWFEKQGGFAHVVAGVWIAGFAAYAAVPPFHQFVIDVWAKTPKIINEAGPALLGLIAWYTSTHKENP